MPHKKYLIILFIFLLGWSTAPAQSRKFKIGFQFGYVNRNNSVKFYPNNSFANINNKDGWGIDLGLAGYYLFNEKFHFRFSPTTEFIEEKFIFNYNGINEELTFGYTYLKWPLHIIITPLKNAPLGIVCGASGNIEIVNNPSNPSDKLKFKRYESFIESGLNYRFITKLCEIIPEFKYALALTDGAGDKGTEYGRAIQKIYKNNWALTLYFR